MTKQEYFNTTVNKVLTSIGCTMNIEISILDHDTLEGKHKNALGCCHLFNNTYKITIDEFFVDECYKYFILDQFWSSWELEGKTLEEIICHELAHIQQWNHCKRHRQITQEILSMIELPEKYYRYLETA